MIVSTGVVTFPANVDERAETGDSDCQLSGIGTPSVLDNCLQNSESAVIFPG
jgi:hypothetical protein